MDSFTQDLRFALRSLLRAPALSAIILFTLGLGIGANTAIFSLMDQVLLRTMPVDEPQDLVLFDGLFDGPGPYSGRTENDMVFSVPMYRGLHAGSREVLSGMFAHYQTSATLVVGAGILIGLPVAWGLSRFVESQLFGLSPTDPFTLLMAATTLSAVALFAGYIPARPATRVEPMLAIRDL